MSDPVTVTAAIIIRDGCALLARRPQGDSLAGYWEFPGGKIEPGETPQECLERELLEEFGLRAKARQVVAENVHTYPHGAIRLIAIMTEIEGGEITLSAHDTVRWVPISEIMAYKLAPADIPIARKVVETFTDLS